MINKIVLPIGSFSLDEIRKSTESLTTKPTQQWKPISASELLQYEGENSPKLLDPILPRVGIAILGGSSDCGKSTFLRQLSTAIVTGEDKFLDFPLTPTHKSVLYVSTEDDRYAVSDSLKRQNLGKNYNPDQLSNLRFIFETDDLMDHINTALKSAPVDLIVIDCLGDVYGTKSMNESNQARAFLNPYKELAEKHQCSVVFLHHNGKRSEFNEPSKNNLLGSQAIEAKSRLVLELRADNHDDSKRHLVVLKGNALGAAFKKTSYTLRFDENLLFHNTGERRSIDYLVKPKSSPEQREVFTNVVKEFTALGKTQRDIAKLLDISLGSVNAYLHDGHVIEDVQPKPYE
jgi:RecA-family ATPase